MPGPILRPRLREPDVTREKILQAAFGEIYRHGFQAASLDAILARAGVTKGALYHHFPSKAALGHAVVDEVITGFLVERWSGTLAERPPDVLSALQAVFRHRAEAAEPDEAEHGCPLNNIAQEMSPLDPEFRRRIAAAYERWVALLADALEAGRRAGTVRAEVDARRTAVFLVSAIEGSYSLAKGLGSVGVLQANLGMLVEYLEGLRTGG